MTKELSIIIPVYNSESCLAQTVTRLVAAMEKLGASYTIILIDDGSDDQSWQVIKKLKASHAQILGARFNKNFGQHSALLCGLSLCDSNYIVTMDDDLEQNPDDIQALYASIKKERYDLVYGMPAKVRKGLVRMIVTRMYKKIAKVENKHAGEGSPFRIFTAELKDSLLSHEGSLFFLDEIVLWYTDHIGHEKVEFQKSLKKHSRYSFGSLFHLSMRVTTLSSTMPLKIMRIIGMYIFMISSILAAYFIYRKVVHRVPIGYTSIMISILFSTGILAFCLGIIGEYLGNLISMSNKKPSYKVREKI